MSLLGHLWRHAPQRATRLPQEPEPAQELHRLIDQLEQLTTSCRRLTTLPTDGDPYAVIARQVADLLAADHQGPWVSVWLYDPGHFALTLKTTAPDEGDWVVTRHLSLSEEPMATVVRERRPLTVSELPAAIRPHVRLPDGISAGAMFVPLAVEDRFLALLLVIGSPAHREAFQRNLLPFKLFTLQAALAVWSTVHRELSLLDPLTRIHNYAYFRDRLSSELKRCHRFDLPLSLLLIDIDGFKAINDTYGHQTGDLVLTTTAKAIQQALRSFDLVARYGGDEFVVMLPELGWDGRPDTCQALPIADRIREAIAHQPVGSSTAPLPITVSIGIGISQGAPLEPLHPDALFKQADEQLYCAKRAGKNRCAVAPR